MSCAVIPWAHTKLEKFIQCPRAFYHAYVLKEKEPETEALRNGKAVHKHLEDRLIGNRPLPPDLMKHEPMMYALKQKQEQGYDLQAEIKFGITEDYKPARFFDNHVWGRGAADVLLLSPDKRSAILLDHKTGKRRDDDTQLSRLALLIFSWFPGLEKITGANIWLNENKIGTNYIFTPLNLPEIKGKIQHTIESVQTAQDRDSFPEKPSHLCTYCPVLACRFNKKGK